VGIEDVGEVAGKYIRPGAYVRAVVKPCGPQASMEKDPADNGKTGALGSEK
jgi:hypothetical protein